MDRWENTPLDDAAKYGHQDIIVLLQKKGALKGATILAQGDCPSQNGGSNSALQADEEK